MKALGITLMILIFSGVSFANVPASLLDELPFLSEITTSDQQNLNTDKQLKSLKAEIQRLTKKANETLGASEQLIDELRYQQVTKRLKAAEKMVEHESVLYASRELDVAKDIVSLPKRERKPGFL
jgi:peptidoglycan hydrolase CwlO-like protein